MRKLLLMPIGLGIILAFVFLAGQALSPGPVFADDPFDPFIDSGFQGINENETSTGVIGAEHDDLDVDDCTDLSFAASSVSGGGGSSGGGTVSAPNNFACIDLDGVAGGTLDFDTAGFTFTPDNSCDTFPVPGGYTANFTVSVAHGADVNDNPVLVQINVSCVDDPPVAAAKTVGTSHNTAVNITLTATDVDSPCLFPEISIVTPPANGSAFLNPPVTCQSPFGVFGFEPPASISQVASYQPNPSFCGTDTFTYAAVNGVGDLIDGVGTQQAPGLVFSSPATVTVVVSCPTPTATPTTPAATPAALPPTGGAPAAADAGFAIWQLLAGLGSLGGVSFLGGLAYWLRRR